MMRSIFAVVVLALASTFAYSQSSRNSRVDDTRMQRYIKSQPSQQHYVYVDNSGVMRWNDTGDEASFYGVNYTAPFAYSYRAISRKGLSHKNVIDRDVYHFVRLGFNAFRLHIWDVEITDSVGNLLNNDHLDLLDYLVASVERRGLSVILTLQTNFGNGYPERNIDTGAYSYLYDKCRVHNDATAIEAQRNYVSSLMHHVNPYTGIDYGHDMKVVGYEINNEPCHSGTPDDTRAYITTMVEALRSAGCVRPILYNASHNYPRHTAAYFDSDIDGTTYQWYPTGLVSGHERKGNFLPLVDRYVFPSEFVTHPSFSKTTKIVYEFDPADNNYAYVYPAVARTFRSAGFQWATQFAYDPTDIAELNCEYQTHYMNLAYTPRKALAQMIAAEAMKSLLLGCQFAPYPADTLFGDFAVSYIRDLAVCNKPSRYYYSNNSDVQPVSPHLLEHVAGVGSSPVVRYVGTGAYFLDKLADGVWRLELMPDVVEVADAYATPSPSRVVVQTIVADRNMSLVLPDLGDDIHVVRLVDEYGSSVESASRVTSTTFAVRPGVYLLSRRSVSPSRFDKSGGVGIGLREYVAPVPHDVPVCVSHTPSPYTSRSSSLTVEATIAGRVDSAYVVPSWASFWDSRVPREHLSCTGAYTYSASLPATWTGGQTLGYYIVVYSGGSARTYPGAVSGTPVDWDAQRPAPYTTRLVENSAVPLVDNASSCKDIEVYGLPDWRRVFVEPVVTMPASRDGLKVRMEAPSDRRHAYYIRRYVGDIVTSLTSTATSAKILSLYVGESRGVDSLCVSLVDNMGAHYTARVALPSDGGRVDIPLAEFVSSSSPILPLAYPSFLPQYYDAVEGAILKPEKVEYVELSAEVDGFAEFILYGIMLDKQ